MTPRVSVVMSNYNGVSLKLVEDSLSSILKNTYPNLEVILVDNASTDNSVEVIQKKFRKNKKFKLLQNVVNMYSQGLNLGIKNSTGKYVAFFNNDATVENGYFEQLIRFLESHKNVALIQGKLLSSQDRKIIDCTGETMDIYGNPHSIGNGEKEKDNYIKQTDILSVTGSCSILRKSVTEEIGYFDNDYGIGYEDMDLALRARMRGYDIVYFPDARVFHKRGATDLSPMIKKTVKWHFNKNRIATLIKDFSGKDILKALPVILLLYFGAGIMEATIKGKPEIGFTRLTALLWIVGNLSNILKKRKEIQKLKKQKYMKTIYSLMLKDNLFSIMGKFISGK